MADNDKKPEVREDEEQEVKAQESMQLLVTAGYFRARIKGLSNFDKIVGGLVWCLETCNFDVDVDLWYNDELTIGGKIALTEKIVTVLNAQKCPHKIEPHQIQGSDFIHIFPVVQWLVKKAIETREATGDSVRQYSLSQYGHYFPSDQTDASSVMPSTVKRKFRQVGSPSSDLETRVDRTLLEYGKSDFVRGTSMGQQHNKEKESSSAECVEQHANEELTDMMSGLASEGLRKLNTRVVSNILSSAEISKAVNQYQMLQEKMDHESELQSVSGLSNLIAQLKQNKARLQQRLDQESEDASQFDEKFRSVKIEVKSLRSKLKSLQEQAQQIQLENDDREKLRQLQALMSKNENLKKKESEFKAKCKSERARLLVRNQELKEQLSKGSDQEESGQDLVALEAKLAALKTELATKSISVSGLERQLDQVPSSYELQQYQRRFFELDSQVSGEFSATQQFVAMYNTLIDQKSFTEKAITLLDSVVDTLPDSRYSTSATKSTFVDKLSKLLQSVEAAKASYERNFRDHDGKKTEATEGLNKLLEEQRNYALLVKEMRAEMRKNEKLAAQLSSSQSQ